MAVWVAKFARHGQAGHPRQSESVTCLEFPRYPVRDCGIASRPLTVRRLDMKQLRWAFFRLRLWVFELRLWMDGLPWEEVRLVAERSKDLARAAYEGELQG